LQRKQLATALEYDFAGVLFASVEKWYLRHSGQNGLRKRGAVLPDSTHFVLCTRQFIAGLISTVLPDYQCLSLYPDTYIPGYKVLSVRT